MIDSEPTGRYALPTEK